MINWSYRIGCLQCSFTDKELIEYIQQKKRSIIRLPKKSAVQAIGKQSNGEWVIGSDITVSSTGTALMDTEQCKNIWISDVFIGSGIPSPTAACTVSLPLSTKSLAPLIRALKDNLEHNFYPSLLLIGATGLVLHYQDFISKLRYCPIPVAFGPSGTCKTTVLESALSLLGAHKSRVYSKVTREKIFDMCCDVAGIPLGVDDPHSKADISKLLVELYNGKKGATMGRGERQPKSTAVVAANFSPSDQTRFGSCTIFLLNVIVITFQGMLQDV